MQQESRDTMEKLDILANALSEFDWHEYVHAWHDFKLQPDLGTYHALNTRLQKMFGVVT
jgi:hypothetical protein